MALVKTTPFINRLLEKLSLPQLEALHNIAGGKVYPRLVETEKALVDLVHVDIANLNEADPDLATKLAHLKGTVDGIIVMKQLMEHSAGELNRRMKEEK